MTVNLSMKYNTRNFVEWSEFSHGFEIENSRPKIYYKPKKNEEVLDMAVLDLGSYTCIKRKFYNLENLSSIIKKTINKNKTLLINSKYSTSPILDKHKNLKYSLTSTPQVVTFEIKFK